MAHAIFLAEAERRSLSVEVYSAGVYDFSGEPPLHDTSLTCSSYNTPSPKDTPTWVRDLPLDSIDRFLVMERHHAHVLEHNYGVSPDRISLLGQFDPQKRGAEVADPFGRGRDVYDASYLQIRDCITGYLDTTDDLD